MQTIKLSVVLPEREFRLFSNYNQAQSDAITRILNEAITLDDDALNVGVRLEEYSAYYDDKDIRLIVVSVNLKGSFDRPALITEVFSTFEIGEREFIPELDS